MKVVVLGGSGFVGTRFVAQLLGEGHDVVIGDSKPSAIFPDLSREVDVCDEKALVSLFEGADVVVNLAAAHRDDIRPVSIYFDVNVGGARSVCRAATAAEVSSIVFTSSVAIYGTTAENEICTEDREPRPFNDYGRSKLEAEGVYREWLKGDSGRRLTIIRPTVIFGEDNRGNVYNLMRQVAAGKFVMIGKGENRKSVAYVENISAFLCRCLETNERYMVLNYVDGPDLSVARLVALIKETLGRTASRGLSIPYWFGWLAGGLLDVVAGITGRTFPISRVRVMKFCANTRFSAAAAMEAGFTPPVEIEDAIQRTVRHEFMADPNGES